MKGPYCVGKVSAKEDGAGTCIEGLQGCFSARGFCSQEDEDDEVEDEVEEEQAMGDVVQAACAGSGSGAISRCRKVGQFLPENKGD